LKKFDWIYLYFNTKRNMSEILKEIEKNNPELIIKLIKEYENINKLKKEEEEEKKKIKEKEIFKENEKEILKENEKEKKEENKKESIWKKLKNHELSIKKEKFTILTVNDIYELKPNNIGKKNKNKIKKKRNWWICRINNINKKRKRKNK
jgi:hypothetical protein